MLDIDKLRAYRIPDSEMAYTKRDTILYALGVGLGSDPTDAKQLQFLCPPQLRALPSMATIIAMPYAWIRKADVGWGGLSVHAGIHVELHKELPPEGRFVSRNSLHEVLDKGPGKAAIVTIRRLVVDAETDEPVISIRSTNMFRGDGGFGGPSQPAEPTEPMPDRSPDEVCDMPTLPQQGLLYQLNGDYNPLHNDPDTARRQGFPRPILHGLSTFGITGHALLKTLCDYDPTRLKSIGGHFTKPVFPGETLRVRMWVDGGKVSFQTSVPTRGDELAINNGTALIA